MRHFAMKRSLAGSPQCWYGTLAMGKPEQLLVELTGLRHGAEIIVDTLDKQMAMRWKF
jgi:hypothetical protein